MPKIIAELLLPLQRNKDKKFVVLPNEVMDRLMKVATFEAVDQFVAAL